jgi:8-oxo-dGTP pyrophosphatase MutT (NUDIX family)
MKKNRIRTIAIGIFIHEKRLLVFEGFDQVKNKSFFRPLGGGIKFGETGSETLKREIIEEIDYQIEDTRYLGLIESRFMLRGEPGHEIVMVYSGRFTNSEIYSKQNILGHESDGSEIKVKWVEISYFKENPGLLVPPELMDFITKIPE